MKRIFSLLIIFLILCGVQSVSAAHKSDRLKPKWVTHTLPKSESNTYFFVMAHGVGSSIEAARQSSFIHLSRKLEDEHGLVINTHYKQHSHSETTTKSSTGHRTSDITIIAEEQGRKINIGCRIVDEYWESKGFQYEMYVLYAVSRGYRGASYSDSIVVTAKYPGAGFLSVVPSVAQFYKGDNLKGGLILGGEVLAAGAILLCENNRASYIKKMKEQPKYAKEYNSLADQWETGRNISIGAAAAIYVYNLIDGFVAKGAKRVVVKKQRVQFSAAPYTDSQSVGMSLALKF
ncbi:MAG: hypothetical protein II214_05270 [Alistipes sp.]|nr:hypothetical protein [Alistipes sp.]